MDERKQTERGKPESESKREAPEEQLWERDREGRKETNRKPSTKNRERKQGKPGRKERGKPKKREWKRSTEEATVRRRQEERGKEETESQVAGGGTEGDERNRKESGKPGREAKAEKKGSTRGTAVGANQGRAKGNKQ